MNEKQNRKNRKSKARDKSTPGKPIRQTSKSTLQETALPFGFSSLAGLVAFCGFVFLVFIAPYLFSGFWPASYEYWSYALFLAVVACILALLSLEPKMKTRSKAVSAVPLGLLLFFVWSALSVFGTAYLHDSLLELARVGGVLSCFLLARLFLSAQKYLDQKYLDARLHCLVNAALLGGTLVCVPAVYDFVATRNPRQFGTFYNPNLFANYSAMLLPFALAQLLSFWRERKKSEEKTAPTLFLAGAFTVTVTIFLGLVFTSSKGGFLAALCGCSVFAAAVYRAKGERVRAAFQAHRLAFLALFFLILVGGGVLFSQTILPRLSANLESDHSTMFRVYTWLGTLKMMEARPFLGWGIGSFPTVYSQFAETGYTRSAHQSWLQVAAESGVPALIFLLGTCVWAFLRGWRKLKSASSENWLIIAGSLSALVAFGVHGLTDSGWGVVSVGVLLATVWAILETESEKETESATESVHSSRQLRPESTTTESTSVRWPALLLALPLALGSWFYQRAQNAEDLRTESREAMARGLASAAVETAEKATETDPLSARIWMNLAQAQRALGNDARPPMEKVLSLQPMRALNSADYAEYLIESGGEQERIRALFESAIRLDPNDPQIRLSYGAWLLEVGDSHGWAQFERVAELAELPYGKYPATPEIVDLSFARAYARLADRAAERGENEKKQRLIKNGLEQIATARRYEAQRREMEAAMHGAPDETRAQELDKLDLQFRELQETAE